MLLGSLALLAAVTLLPERTEVLIAPRASGPVEFAAMEMTNVLSLAFGRAIPIVRAPTAGKTALVLGANDWSAAAGIDVAKLPDEGFRIRTVGTDRVFIAGRDDPTGNFMNRLNYSGTMKVRRATSFGVYEFLERFADVRFFFPGELGTVIPRRERIDVPDTDFTDAPDYPIRSYYTGGGYAWYAPTGEGRGSQLNVLRLRMESETVPCCHGSIRFRYPERFGATHPEYFATDGKGNRCCGQYNGSESSRDGHLCWTSGVTNELYLDARAYLKGEPASSRGLKSWGRNCVGGKYVDIMPNDSFYDCQCGTCARVRAKDGQYAAERVWGATAAIAQRLIDEGVPGFITQMAYTPYGRVPDLVIPTNVLVMVARTGPFSKYDAKSRAQQKADIVAWTKKTGRKVWLWNYPGKVAELALKGVPQMCPRAWGEYYREMSPYILGAFAESETDRWFFNHLNFYVFGKVCWRNETDIDALLDDYYARMYGPAAGDVKALFEALEEMWLRNVTARCVDTPLGPQCRPPSVHDLWTKVYTRERIAAWSALLRRAVGKVPRGSLEWRRLELVWNEILKPLSQTSADYLDGISVEKELARRAAETDVVSVVTNGDFTARPNGRFFGGWYVGEPPAPLDGKTFVTAPASVRIEGAEEGAVVTQYLPALKPSTRYRLSYFLKLDDLQCTKKGGGAGVSMMQGFQHWYPSRTSYTGTMDWTHCAFEFTSDPETGRRGTPYIRLRLSAGTSGTAWFDGVRLVELGPAEAAASDCAYPVPQVVSRVDEIGYVRVSGADRAAVARSENPGRKVGLVASRMPKGAEGYDERPTRDREAFAAIRAKLDYFEFDAPLPDVVSIQMHDAGVKTVRVIDDPEDVQPDADLGVKYLVSPDPARTRRALADLQVRMRGPVTSADFRIRDPFVLADGPTRTYYLYETTPWNTGRGVNVRTSKDLKTWSAPRRAMTMPEGVRCRSVWAPEVHAYKGAYYLFATPTLEPDPAHPIRSMADDPSFRPPECYALTRRGTWIWKSDSPEGPFAPVSDMSATPHDLVALDGTLSIDPDGTPWMVYSHCWTQVKVGRVEAARLKPDLSGLAEKPHVLFRADAAFGDNHVMDGPFLYRSPKSGALFMIWSKFCSGGYSVVSCRSGSGGVAGPWGDFRMVFPGNGGHGMIFRTFDGKLKLVMHKPEVRGRERLAFFDLEDTGDALNVVGIGSCQEVK